MTVQYLIRLDDACPMMDHQKWQHMEDLLDQYSIRPMVGIIPNNTDSDTMIDEADAAFWIKAKAWESKGWCIALHGYSHVCDSNSGMQGLNPMWERSEFAGIALDEQKIHGSEEYEAAKEYYRNLLEDKDVDCLPVIDDKTEGVGKVEFDIEFEVDRKKVACQCHIFGVFFV